MFLAAMLVLVGCGREGAPAEAPPAAVGAPGLEFGASITQVDSGRVKIIEQPWTLDGAPGWAIVARFPRDASMAIQPSDAVVPLDQLGTVGDDQAMSNGGFYDSGAMGLVVHDGVRRTELSRTGGSGVVAWAPGQPIIVVHRDAWTGGGTEALQSVDRLVDRGVSLVHPKADARRTARTGLGVADDAVFLVVAASTRSAPATGTNRSLYAAEDDGLPLWAFADLMVHLGAREAINFDGGISAGLRARVAGQSWSVDGGSGTINAVLLYTLRATP